MSLLGKKKIEKSEEEIKKEQRKRTANQWVPIKDIEGNIAYTKEGYMIGIIRVEPVKIDLLSKREKKRKIGLLAEQLNPETDVFQIFCIGRPIDLNSYIEWLQDKVAHEKNMIRKMMLKDMISDASKTSQSGDITERRFYFIIKSKEKEGNKQKQQEFLERIKALETRLIQADLEAKICNQDEIFDLYSLFAHPISTAYEDNTIEYELSPLYLEDI